MGLAARIDGIFAAYPSLRAKLGVIAERAGGELLADHNATASFPLASAAKLAIGALVVHAARRGELAWDTPLTHVALDPKENSDELYPYLQGDTALTARDVVEVMVACHDHNCADALAQILGGWSALREGAAREFPGIALDADLRNTEYNVGRLDAVAGVVRAIADGYHREPLQWRPVIAGMSRQSDIKAGIPPQRVFNLTGGLPTALLDAGILGELAGDRYIVYAVAGRDLPDRRASPDADAAAEALIQALYAAVG